MKHRIEKPITKIVAAVLTAFLVFNLIPVGSFSVRAEGEEPLVSAELYFVYWDGTQMTGVDFDGSYSLTSSSEQAPEKTLTGVIMEGRAEVTGFEEGYSYNLWAFIGGGSHNFYDCNTGVSYGVNLNGPSAVLLMQNGSAYNVYCQKRELKAYEGTVRDAEGNPVSGATITVTSVEDCYLPHVPTSQTDENGSFSIALPNIPGKQVQVSVSKQGYHDNGFTAVTGPAANLGECTLSVIDTDISKPVFEFPEDEDMYNYYNAGGLGGKNVTKARILVKEGNPSGPSEPISGLSQIYFCNGAYGSLQNVIEAGVEPIQLESVESYLLISDVQAGATYTYFAVDAAGNVSDRLCMTYQNDNDAPSITNVGLFSDSDCTVTDGITEEMNGYVSPNTMYLQIMATDGGSGLKQAELYVKGPFDAEYKLLGTYYPAENQGPVRIALTAGNFQVLTNLGIVVSDKVGNRSSFSEIAALGKGLTKNAVAVVGGGPSIEEHIEGECVSVGEESPLLAFRLPPEFTFTLSDKAGYGIRNVSISVNDVKLQSDDTGKPVSEDLSYNSGVQFVISEAKDAQGQSLLKEGLNIIRIRCQNAAGIVSEKTYVFLRDVTPPSVTGIQIEPESEGTTMGVVRGQVYANGTLKVTVSADDGDYSSDVKTISICYDDKVMETKEAFSGSAEFVIPSGYSGDMDYSMAITFVLCDRLGNESARIAPTADNSNTGSGKINISAAGTEIVFRAPEAAEFDGRKWYTAPPSITAELKDTFAGLGKVQISVNGVLTTESPYNYAGEEKVSEDALTINLNEYTAGEDGSYLIEVTTENSFGVISANRMTVYVDNRGAEISEYDLAPVENSGFSMLVHGTYVTDSFQVIVRAQDDKTGTDKIVLLADGVEIGSGTPDENGVVVFVVPFEYFSDQLTCHSIGAYAVDRLGNMGAVTALSADNSNALSADIIFDRIGPVVGVTPVEGTPEGRITGEGETQKTWYSSDIIWDIELRDSESGLGSYSVSLNGTVITEDAYGTELVTNFSEAEQQIVSQSFSVSTAQAAANEDCSYELVVSAADNAGNVSEVYRQVVYIDGGKPVISGFVVASAEPEGTLTIVPEGTFMNGRIAVTVTAGDTGDGPKSGIRDISLYLNGELFETQPADQESGTYTFYIPAEELPEGYSQTIRISAAATDCSGLTAEVTAPSRYNSNVLSDSVTIENKAPQITIRLPEEGQKVLDEDRIWYGTDFEFGISGTDDESGAAQLKISINGSEVTTDANGNDIPATFLGQDPEDAVSEYLFRTEDYNDNNDTFEIQVTLTDAAGNVAEVTKTIRIDRRKPAITGFLVKPETEADSIHYLLFGTFANGRVEITVSVSDEELSSGADKVLLYVNGGTEPLVADVTDGKAVFVVPEENLGAGFDGSYTFSAAAVDRYGNIGDAVELGAGSVEGMTNNVIRIEKAAPTISVAKEGEPGKTENETQWHLSDVIWNVRITDAQSGIAAVSVVMNGTPIVKDTDGKDILTNYGEGGTPVSELQFSLNSNQVDSSAGNAVTVEITATDNAGNVSTVYKDTIYKDSTAPAVKGFRFRPQGGTEGELAVPGTDIAARGQIFGRDTVVRISAVDTDNGSGVKQIQYYTKKSDGTLSTIQTAAADTNGDIFITIQAPFKGELFARASDRLDNTGEYVSVKGIIVENPDSHNTETHITLTKPQATGVQSNGTELYNANVELNLRIADHYSGIKTVEWSVTAPYDQTRNQAGTLTVSDNGALNGDGGWTVVSTDGKMVTELTKAIVVSNDSNDITVRIRMRDAAGNVSERQMTFGIDKTVPTVEYSFDNTTPDSDYGNIYNQSRTMTIVVTERNFVPGDFTFSARNTDGSAPAIGRWTEETDPNDPNKTIHTTTVSFFSDGNYSIGLSYSDRAGNRAGIAAVPSFIIDRTRPIINVSFDNNDAKNGNYYNTERTATVTVVERNFDVSRVQLDGNAQKTGIWTANGDQHSITLTFSKDGSYSFTVSASDRAGNTTETYTSETFIIDTTAPELTLEGFDRANGGEVAPIITCMDDNFDPAGVNINLTRISNKEVHVRYTTSEIEDEERTGMRWTYANIDPEQENDDLYTFRISATDKAGNACETIIKSFSVNRYGSTYDLNSIENLNGKYSSVTEDLVIYEYNVDEIDTDEVTVELLRNNEHRNLVRGKDYAVETVIEKDQEFNKYKYVIRKEVFAQDGEYSIQIVSQDKAGNVNQNTEKGAESRIAFCIDKIEPDIIVIEPVSGGSYAQPSLTATVLIRDNYKLDKVHFILDGVELQANVSGDTFTIEIPESDSKQTLEIYATDAAGNVARTEIKDILVTSSMFIRFIHNTAALVTTIILLLLLLALAVFMVIHRRRSKA